MCSQSNRGPIAAAVQACSPEEVPLTSSERLDGLSEEGSTLDLLMEYPQSALLPLMTFDPEISRSV